MRVLLVLLFALSACRDPSSPNRVPEGAETPQAAIADLRRAYESRDGKAYLACIEPELRELLLDFYLVAFTLNLDPAIPDAANKAMDELWKKNGIRVGRGGNLPGGAKPLIPRQIDRGALLGEVLEIDAKHSLARGVLLPSNVSDLGGVLLPAAWVLRDLELEQDEAYATVVTRFGEREVENELQLKRIDGRWFVTPRPYIMPKDK